MSFNQRSKVKLKNLLVEPVRNGIYKQKEFHGSGCKIINMGELFAHPRLHDVPMKRVELNDKEMAKCLVQQGDLLFARRSLVASGAGKCSIVKHVAEPTTFESSIIRARPNSKIVSSEYLFYYFSSPQGREQMSTILRQVAVSGITGSDLMELEIECPPIDEQKLVAEFLDELDNRIALLYETNSTLEGIVHTLFKSWFVDFDPVSAKMAGQIPNGMDEATAGLFPDELVDSKLGPLPIGWKILSLDTIADVVMGLSPDGGSYNVDGIGTPLINGPVEFGDYFPVAKKWTNAPTRLCKVGDLIFCVRGSTTGKRVVSDGEYCIGRGVAGIRSKDSADEFLQQTISFELPRLLGKTTGSVFPSLSAPDIKGFMVRIPDSGVLNAFQDKVKPIVQKVKENHRQVRILASLRDTLLPRLISGQLHFLDKKSQTELNAA